MTTPTLLAIDCTESPMSVALRRGTTTILKFAGAWQKSSEEILPLIEACLNEANTPRSALDAVVLSAGPGSFTALRIGIATAKGLCFALEKPLILVPTLEAMLSEATLSDIMRSGASHKRAALVYSKADEFYVGHIQEKERIVYEYFTLTQIAQSFSKDTLFFGRNLERHAAMFRQFNISAKSLTTFSAASLFALAEKKFLYGEVTDLASAEPLYLKNFEVKKKSS
jgi:tRNA threonylcarbamoyladenosine biosynthesis protein TsaB